MRDNPIIEPRADGVSPFSLRAILVVPCCVIVGALGVTSSSAANHSWASDRKPIDLVASGHRDEAAVHLDYSRTFRSQFGLDTSDAAIQAALHKPAEGSVADWGLELTAAEYSEMSRRQSAQRHLPELAEAVVGADWSEELTEGLDPSGSFGALGGRWIDQLAGGRLVIALATTHPDYADALARLTAKYDELIADGSLGPKDLRIEQVQFSADELYAVNAAFAEEYLESPDVDARSVGMSLSINEVNNTADLYIYEAWADVATEFAARFDSGLVRIVVADDGSLDSADGDLLPQDDWGAGNWHAGAAIYVEQGGGLCSWAITTTRSGRNFVVTAGHCLSFDKPYDPAGFWNDEAPAGSRRGVRSYSGNDEISDLDGHVFVFGYHGTRGDVARIQISNEAVVHDHECYLQQLNFCGKRIVRREMTTETEVGDPSCGAYSNRQWYMCFPLVSNDAPIVGYDYLRSFNTTSSTHSIGGDSGTGIKESELFSGVLHGHVEPGSYDTNYTHAYYVEDEGYLRASNVCGTVGAC